MRYPEKQTPLLFFLLGTLLTGPLYAMEVDYEKPRQFSSETLLGKATSGPNYTVNPTVQNDGRINHFVIDSPFGSTTASGNAHALERGREMEAIAQIRRIKKTDAFVEALGKAAVSPLNASEQIITQPVQTLKDLPGGVTQLFKNLFTSLSSMGKSKSKEENETLKELMGYQKAKRQLAAKLGVDPYSSNPLLQKELKSVTWATFAGGSAVDAALLIAPTGVAGLAVTAVQQTAGVTSLVRENSPTTLLTINTEKMQKMQIPKEDIEGFNFHPHCTPFHQTYLVDALLSLKESAGREHYIRLASSAHDETACRDYMEMAGSIQLYRSKIAPVLQFFPHTETVVFEDMNGQMVIPIYADYLLWTPETEEIIKSFPTRSEKRVVWIKGEYSDRVEAELKRRGISIVLAH
ncbi:MAG: hypothetical protein HQL72_09900 [Magnetococcales bacterium]|nr:hypothetical protein [Magnetococcales bacterium]